MQHGDNYCDDCEQPAASDGACWCPDPTDDDPVMLVADGVPVTESQLDAAIQQAAQGPITEGGQ